VDTRGRYHLVGSTVRARPASGLTSRNGPHNPADAVPKLAAPLPPSGRVEM
jgi:hypothetical protein